jgi:hypothetical protein
MNGLGGRNLARGVANVGIARKGVSIDSDLSLMGASQTIKVD